MVVHENVAEVSDSQLQNVPLFALEARSREILCALLDPEKVIPSPNGYPRDWRGLAALAKIPGEYTAFINSSSKSGKTNKVLELWQKSDTGPPATVSQLQTFLQLLDRWDIYDDTLSLFKEDAESYTSRSVKAPSSEGPQQEEAITDDDVVVGPAVQRYHAYVLYDPADQQFASQLIDTLRKRRFMICCEDNLLLGALTKVGPITKLISERCERLIVIFSPDFLKSPANKFYMDYAQSLAIENQTRKIIPCLYRQCELQSSYKYLHMIYYSHAHNGDGPLFNFWDKLEKSLSHNSQLHRLPAEKSSTNVETTRKPEVPTSRALPSSSAPESSPETVLPLPSPPMCEVSVSSSQKTQKKATFLTKLFKKSKNKKNKELAICS